MKTISLYPNEKRDRGFSYTIAAAECLMQSGAEVLLPKKFQKELTRLAGKVRFVSEKELFDRAACLVTLGGDGTILSVARAAAERNLPICGINLGHVGFMTALEKNQIEKLSELVAGKFYPSSRMMLSCSVAGKGELCALNEICIAPEKGFHIVEMSLLVGRKKFCDFRADGVIFHTPTGSTGYAFSAGGAVVDAEMDCVGVKAVSSFLLQGAHPMLFPPETVFTVKNLQSAGGRVTACADGREEIILSEGDEIVIRRADVRTRLVFRRPKSNLELFFHKF